MSHWEDKRKGDKSDEWYTPRRIFDGLNCHFDLDVAAPKDRKYVTVPANEFITEDSLHTMWNGFVWMNPPFGGRNGIVPWLNRIAEHNNGIALTPDRTSAPWWQNAARAAKVILFVNGKVKFLRPDGTTGDSPSNGTTLLAYGDKAARILGHADPKLGIVR